MDQRLGWLRLRHYISSAAVSDAYASAVSSNVGYLPKLRVLEYFLLWVAPRRLCLQKSDLELNF